MPMVMKENGNYEYEEPFWKHQCIIEVDGGIWKCTQNTCDPKDVLTLGYYVPQCCYDDEYEIKVSFCPFCGYKAGTNAKGEKCH